MAHTLFEMGFQPGSHFDRRAIGFSLKDLEAKASNFFGPATPAPAAAPVQAPKPPQDTILGLPPTVAALGGLGLLGTLAAIAFGHK